MYHFTNSLSHTASILILVVICVERYMAILHPFKFRQILTITRLRVSCFVSVQINSSGVMAQGTFLFSHLLSLHLTSWISRKIARSSIKKLVLIKGVMIFEEPHSQLQISFLTVDHHRRMAHQCNPLLTKALLHHNVRNPVARWTGWRDKIWCNLCPTTNPLWFSYCGHDQLCCPLPFPTRSHLIPLHSCRHCHLERLVYDPQVHHNQRSQSSGPSLPQSS